MTFMMRSGLFIGLALACNLTAQSSARATPPDALTHEEQDLGLLSQPNEEHQAATVPAESLLSSDLNLADLLNIKVVSAGRTAEALRSLSAAAYVLTDEDLRRFGSESLADALRYVPGMHVRQVTRGSYAVSARLQATEYSNKLQVLVDGRSIYSPLFGGVYWEAVNPILSDLEQIEVIRGPGGATWGANAVNGVLNIRSKPAAQTLGWSLAASAGTETDTEFAVRYGDALDDDFGHWRISARGFLRQEQELEDGGRGFDDHDALWLGFRADLDLSHQDQLILMTDLHATHLGDLAASYGPSPRPNELREGEQEMLNGALSARWIRSLDGGSTLDVATSLAYEDRKFFGGARSRILTVDLDAVYERPIGESFELIAGAGWRLTTDEVLSNQVVSSRIDHQDLHIAHLFGSLRYDMIPNELHATLGLRAEHNEYVGLEWQPTLRFAWEPNQNLNVWGAVSRATRSPTRLERTLSIVSLFASDPRAPLPILAQANGNSDFRSEVLLAYELGIRGQPCDNLTLDLALFLHDYERLIGGLRDRPSPAQFAGTPVLASDIRIVNSSAADVLGAELAARWLISETLDLRLNYTYTHLRATSAVAPGEPSPRRNALSPRHLASAWLFYDFAEDWEFNVGVWLSDEVRTWNLGPEVRVDANLQWHFLPEARASLGVRDAFHEARVEGRPEAAARASSAIERSLWLGVEWRF